MANQLFRKKSIPTILRDAQQGLSDSEGHRTDLKRVLKVRDLTFFGIAAIIGAGSFSSIGSACFSAGPGVIFLFLICAVACAHTVPHINADTARAINKDMTQARFIFPPEVGNRCCCFYEN